MNIYHYILLAFSLFGSISSIKNFKEKTKIQIAAELIVSAGWIALIILSAYN